MPTWTADAELQRDGEGTAYQTLKFYCSGLLGGFNVLHQAKKKLEKTSSCFPPTPPPKKKEEDFFLIFFLK